MPSGPAVPTEATTARSMRCPVLMVSDSKAFASRGGAVQLFLSEGRMLFSVNRQAAERSGLRLSSKLLGLSRPVED